MKSHLKGQPSLSAVAEIKSPTWGACATALGGASLLWVFCRPAFLRSVHQVSFIKKMFSTNTLISHVKKSQMKYVLGRTQETFSSHTSWFFFPEIEKTKQTKMWSNLQQYLNIRWREDRGTSNIIYTCLRCWKNTISLIFIFSCRILIHWQDLSGLMHCTSVCSTTFESRCCLTPPLLWHPEITEQCCFCFPCTRRSWYAWFAILWGTREKRL